MKADTINESYSSKSSASLAEDFVENFKLSDFVISFGPWLGLVIFLYLKALDLEEREKILAVISPFRSGVKSIGIAEQTGALMAIPGLGTGLAKGITSGIGIINGVFLIGYLLPQIADSEKSFNQKIELNQLLAKHLKNHTHIPHGLSEEKLIQWLKNPDWLIKSLTPITADHFHQLTEAELNRYAALKWIEELINGFYSVSVLKTDSDLMNFNFISQIAMHINKVNPLHWINLGINLTATMILVPQLINKAQHQAKGLALKVEQSYLAGKLALIDHKAAAPEILSLASTPTHSAKMSLQDQRNTTEQQLNKCNHDYQQNQARNFDNLELATATTKGFQEGGDNVEFYTSIPLCILTIAHVVSAGTCPPLFFVLLGATIAFGLYRAKQRFTETQQKIAEKNKSLPAKAPSMIQSLSNACCSIFNSKRSDGGDNLRLICSY